MFRLGVLLILVAASGCYGIDVTIANGTVTGTVETVDGRQVWQFLGIPFAEPPVGPLRFLPPHPIKEKWPKPLIADKPPNGCLQQPVDIFQVPDHLKVNYSEDCLYVDVWAPPTDSKQKKSVMVWIHGGGFTIGEGLPFYQGKALAVIGNVVLVVIQYRLGFLGFARLDNSLVPGNLGLLDQQLALRWVHENIEAFGGDPNSVTIFGESAGSGSVSMHLLNKESDPYFHRGIMQSGTVLNFWAVNPNIDAMEKVARDAVSKYLNCHQKSSNELLKCIQEKSEEEMLQLIKTFALDNPTGPYFGPVVDGHFFHVHPKKLIDEGQFSKKDIMIGVNEDEGSLFLQFMGSAWMGAMNITTPTQDIFNATFASWVVDNFFKYYPLYPNEISPIALKMLHVRAVSHIDPSRSDLNGKRLSKLISEYLMDCGVNNFADGWQRFHDNVYFYQLANKLSKPLIPLLRQEWMGAAHGDDLPLVFHSPLQYPHLNDSLNEEEIFLSKRIIGDFVSFAKTGLPQDPNWRPYTLQNKEYYRYSITSSLQKGGVKRDECAFWDHIMPMLNSLSCSLDAESKCSLSMPTTTTPATPQDTSRRADEL